MIIFYTKVFLSLRHLSVEKVTDRFTERVLTVGFFEASPLNDLLTRDF